MRVVLINPPHLYLKQPKSQSPLGLMYLAAILEGHGHDVVISDYTATQWKDIKLPYADLYGITGTVVDVSNINRLTTMIRKNTASPVVVGGPCTVVHKALIADSCVIGEGELTIIKVVDDHARGHLQKLYQGKVVTDLNKLPMPARHLLNYLGGDIFIKGKKYKGNGSTVITSSRGCPFKCAFCSSPKFWDQKVRFRSPENVVKEVEHVIEKYGIKQFRFSDDSFTANPTRAIKISELLKPLDVAWRVSVRVNPHDTEMWQAMYDGGCKEVSFGIESFDQRVLDFLKKGTTVNDNVAAICNANSVGLKVRVLMMVATPGQLHDSMELNEDWIGNLSEEISSVSCTAFMPLPGSDIWVNPKSYGIKVTNTDYENYNFYLFGPDGVRDMPVAITHLDRKDEEVIAESMAFRDWLVSSGLANEG